MTMRYCPVCNGLGFIRRTEHVGCIDCGGVGRIGPKNCPACNARGTQPVEMHRVCQQCGGSGMRIPEEPAG